MPNSIATLEREYIHHHLDSTGWNAFDPRDEGSSLSTPYESGTTWMRHILHGLIFRDQADALPVALTSPRLDARFHAPLEEVMVGLEAFPKATYERL